MTDRLDQRIERFLRTGEGEFEPLALELFAYQFEKNLPYQAFCRATGRIPGNITRWQDIPAVPISAFKSSELVTFPVGHAAAVFHSSGTTQKTPSRHFLRTLTYYETALTSTFQKWVMPDFENSHPREGGDPASLTPLDSRLRHAGMTMAILAPSPAEAPHSSLSWMLDVVKRTWGAPGSDTFVQRGWVDERRLFRVLAEKEAAGQPVALLGTTLAFLTFFDFCVKHNRHFRCAPGSRVMDTGGMKTQTREVTREDFLRQVWTHLGIPEAQCINEYGMCEMSSQFYARGASMIFSGPPWVRTLAVEGILTHFDLANVDSVMAIQTEDRGEVKSGGFLFQGRAPATALKGCSVDMEAYLRKS